MIKKFISIEEALKSCLSDLNDNEIRQATKEHAGVEKDKAHFYRCSDENKQHDIHHKYSLALDIACVIKGKLPSMLKAHEAILEKYRQKNNTSNQAIANNTNQLSIDVATLSLTIARALEDNVLTQAELSEIRKAIKKSEEAIVGLKVKLEDEIEKQA